jgi:hypothetical protein
MRAKSVCLGGLVAAFLGAGLARGQGPTSPSAGGQMPGIETGPVDSGAIIEDSPRVPGNVPFYDGPQSLRSPGTDSPSVAPEGRTTLSSWILYPRSPGCCGPTGLFGPIGEELFLDGGLSFVVGSSIFGHALGVGFDVEGGARTLFYNPACDAAWTVSFSVSNNFNHAFDETEKANVSGLTAGQTGLVTTDPTTGLTTINSARAQQFGINPNSLNGTTTQVLPSFPLTPRNLNRTYANLGLGREWFLWGPAHVDGLNNGALPNWKVGFEFGPRWGTADLEVNEVTHLTETIYAAYVAIFTNFEYPWHGCVFTAGIRGEFGYTWCDILQEQNRTDLEDINLLLTVGVRF